MDVSGWSLRSWCPQLLFEEVNDGLGVPPRPLLVHNRTAGGPGNGLVHFDVKYYPVWSDGVENHPHTRMSVSGAEDSRDME